MPNRTCHRRLHPFAKFAVIAVSIPLTFVGILYLWNAIDVSFGHREVVAFIDRHQQLVQDRLKDPHVHSFSLSVDPDHAGTLLIHFDVEDKETYLTLESDLDEVWSMRFPPTWDTSLRSNDDLGKNYGVAAWGMALVYQTWMRLGVAAAASVVVFGVVVWRFVSLSGQG